MNKKTNVTLKTIAEMTDVSKTTVSRYLNGKMEFISAATQERIREAIEKTGYRPNRIAGSLKMARSNLIGLVLASGFVMRTPIYIGSICEYCRKYGMKVIVTISDSDLLKEQELAWELLEQQVDGLIVTTGRNTAFYEKLNAEQLPVVLLDPPTIGQEPKLDWVACNQYESVYDLVEHLIRKGYQKIDLVLSEAGVNLALADTRKAAVQDVCMKYFGNYDSLDIIAFDSSAAKETDQKIMDYLEQIAEASKTTPTAIFVAHGVLLDRILFLCYRMGLKFSNSFTIAGYDLANYGRLDSPGLITIKQPLSQMAEEAAALLIERINEEEPSKEPKHIQLDCEISM